jgi:hypothetical protein
VGLLSAAEFTTLLFVAVLLQGFALILGRARGLSRRGGAEEKAGALLKEWLSPAQLEVYEKNGHFEVTGGHSGKHYRIRRAHAMNIDELDERLRAGRSRGRSMCEQTDAAVRLVRLAGEADVTRGPAPAANGMRNQPALPIASPSRGP